jgi:hypothetical protein
MTVQFEQQLKDQLEERKKKWWAWHKLNPQVWEKFEEYTLEAVNSGRKHYSHWAIVNRIRWNREIETKGGEFKISNDYICFYARLFHARYPEHNEFFRLKPLKEEKLMAELVTQRDSWNVSPLFKSG